MQHAAACARRRAEVTAATVTATEPDRRRVTAGLQHAQAACGATPRRRSLRLRRKVSRFCKHLWPSFCRVSVARRAARPPALRGVWKRGALTAGLACAARGSRRSHGLTGFLAVAVPLLLDRPPRQLPPS